MTVHEKIIACRGIRGYMLGMRLETWTRVRRTGHVGCSGRILIVTGILNPGLYGDGI